MEKLINQSDLDGYLAYAREELWKAQEQHFPGSTLLTSRNMLQIAQALTESKERGFLRTLVLALNHPVHIFYVTAAGEFGCRYGIDGPDYISGFPR